MTLATPFSLRGRIAPSRAVFGAHVTNLADGRRFSSRHAEYYRRRAAGGAGIVVTEDASVHESDWPYERSPLAADDEGGWAAVAAAIHAEGALVLAGLNHSGGQGSSAYSQSALWAPSRVPEVNTREVPKQMEAADIDAVIGGFAAAARRAVDAGCDGVDVNIGQHSLIRQFASGLTNQRGDEWADRPQFALAVLAAVRNAIGDGPIVAVRLSCDELAPWAGITPEMGAELAVELCAGADLLTVVRGSIFSSEATRPDGHVPAGFNNELVALVGAAVRDAHGDRVAIAAQGSIVDVAMADELLGGAADLVEMTRAQIADAELVRKVRDGDAARVRPCVLCNQTCQVRDARNPVVTCVVDPRSGHETVEPDADHADRAAPGVDETPTEVLVVGGGIAGLEAARCLAITGHRVELRERAGVLGGMVRTAAAGAGRERLSSIADWLIAECERLGVESHTSSAVTVDMLEDARDTGLDVVLATGSRPSPRGYRTTPKADVMTAAEVLDGRDPAPGTVLVWDPIGGPVAVSVAESLAAAGRTVVFATPDGIVGNELSRTGDLAPANARLQQAGVQIERRVTIDVVKKGSVVLADRFSDQTRTIRAATVVDCAHRLADDELWGSITGGHRVTVVRAGDCVAPRTIHEAILDGRRAAGAIDGVGSTSDGVAMGVLHGH